ncbi:MAG: ATP-binding cassette domain-containing protein [Acutalibacter sp.]|jgi:ABC-2 type transport system ATP-binding protein|uniref:ATP-binding cassette domain-containing protein n=1 Tax=Acutalibacter sp. TaxID=1918636 RepID=UPI00216C4466|nr:ATP-binding cassette domain-containing protein [Acutalibacter sp.]MCI9225522.1 ATP-binding cassette domain-containing protein [Acutalibacter sp.]
MEYVLQTSALGKTYRSFKALDNFNISVPKGAIYGIVGKNGAGKTTLLRLICGLQMPTYGTYSLYGINDGSPDIVKARRRMGAVVETPSIYLDMTATDNLRQQCRVLGLPDFSCVPELLELVGLSDTGRKKAKNFSLGMRQRLGIAVALCGEPDFLVLDEPVNGLDPQGIVEIRELILKLNRERDITVLISSHILEEMHKLATHYGFIDGGCMIREISAEELEATCRKCIRADVSDTQATALVLDKMQLEYKILDNKQVDIYDAVNMSKLISALSEKGCEVFSVQNHDESLESYFLSLVGTGKGGERR